MKRSSNVGRQLSFEAKLQNWEEGMDYCAVPVPAKITQALGTNGPVLVMARVNQSAPFKVSLFPVGGGQHYIRIKAKVRRETNTKTGDRVRIRITCKISRMGATRFRASGATDCCVVKALTLWPLFSLLFC